MKELEHFHEWTNVLASQIRRGDELILHLRVELHQQWKPYTQFPGIAIPDYRVPGASKGFATSQKLLAAGWTLVPTAEVRDALKQNKAA